mmetsp:Transcript_65497/g.105206  ORF Transcript_65497/g.105206 Transcript_65497/m.105206 type:complete len:214 (-) Transcript_65497:229-870(-)
MAPISIRSSCCRCILPSASNCSIVVPGIAEMGNRMIPVVAAVQKSFATAAHENLLRWSKRSIRSYHWISTPGHDRANATSPFICGGTQYAVHCTTNVPGPVCATRVTLYRSSSNSSRDLRPQIRPARRYSSGPVSSVRSVRRRTPGAKTAGSVTSIAVAERISAFTRSVASVGSASGTGAEEASGAEARSGVCHGRPGWPWGGQGRWRRGCRA